MTRLLKMLPLGIVLALIALVSFAATAFAAGAATGDDASLLEMLRPIYEAVTGGQYAYAGALLIIALVALVKRYGGDRFPWLHGNTGGTLLALVMAMATAMATGLATPGAKITLDMLKSSLLVGIGAAGGYAAIKNLIIDPLLRPLATKAPAWMQPIFKLVFWIFDKPSTTAVKDAEAAGDAAVADKPAEGVDGIAGKPTDVP